MQQKLKQNLGIMFSLRLVYIQQITLKYYA